MKPAAERMARLVALRDRVSASQETLRETARLLAPVAPPDVDPAALPDLIHRLNAIALGEGF